jgi:OPT oligopeptide transporter protein
MRVYPTVPAWWYLSLFGVTLLAAVILIETAPLQLPAWALLLAIFVAMAFLVPVGIIRAVSETQIGAEICCLLSTS